jgi:protease-4
VALSRGVRFILVFIVLSVCVVLGGVLVTYILATRGPSVQSGSVLWLRIPGNLTEYVPDSLFGQLIGRRRETVGSVVEVLRKAKVDERVEGVVLIPSMQQGMWGKVQEIRDAVLDFRESGKPIVAYLEYGGGQQYYVATAADAVFLTPTSSIDLVGVASYELFLREGLDTMGVYPDMLHAGDFKTASNLYTETTFTPEHREMAESLNRDLYEQLVSGIAAGRDLTEVDVRRLIDDGPFLPGDAVANGLVDGLLYEDEVIGYDPLPASALRQLEYQDYQRLDARSLGLNGGPKVAVVYAAGTITFGGSGLDVSGSEIVGSHGMVRAIREAREDTSVEAIVVRIDSPGGVAIASDIIWRELELARQEKPVIASMSDVAASGGYYIAAPADVIVSQPGTLTGSIGVVGGKFSVEGTLERLGINVETITDGAMADLNSPFSPFSDESRVRVQRQIDAMYETFVQRVADGREMSRDDVHDIAQGRVWTGRQAKDLGLVDELGGFRRALDIAKEQAGIDVEQEVTVVPYPRPRSFFETLNRELTTQLLAARFVSSPVDRLKVITTLPLRLFRPGEPLALMPGWGAVLLSR